MTKCRVIESDRGRAETHRESARSTRDELNVRFSIRALYGLQGSRTALEGEGPSRERIRSAAPVVVHRNAHSRSFSPVKINRRTYLPEACG